MKRRLPMILAATALLLGAILMLWGRARLEAGSTLPVYTDDKAPERLSRSLEELPRDERFREWYRQLATYETPHKRLVDSGRGMIATGGGVILGCLVTMACLCLRIRGRRGLLLVAWVLLWMAEYSLVERYYEIRQRRFDYPVWGDSTGIGIIGERAGDLVGMVVSLFVVGCLLGDRKMPDEIRWKGAESFRPRKRQVFLLLWILVTAETAREAMLDGEEGMALACTAALPLLALVFFAEKRVEIRDCAEAPDDPAVGCEAL